MALVSSAVVADNSRYIDPKASFRFSCNVFGFVLVGLELIAFGHPDLGCPRRGCPHLVHVGAFRPGVISGDTSKTAVLPAGDE